MSLGEAESRKRVAGTRLGPYQALTPLGAGGMGEVFRARDTRLNRDVAVKVLPSDWATDAGRLRRFEQEARALAALNHPNLLTVHDTGLYEGAPYLVSERLEGRTLREELAGGALAVSGQSGPALAILQELRERARPAPVRSIFVGSTPGWARWTQRPLPWNVLSTSANSGCLGCDGSPRSTPFTPTGAGRSCSPTWTQRCVTVPAGIHDLSQR